MLRSLEQNDYVAFSEAAILNGILVLTQMSFWSSSQSICEGFLNICSGTSCHSFRFVSFWSNLPKLLHKFWKCRKKKFREKKKKLARGPALAQEKYELNIGSQTTLTINSGPIVYSANIYLFKVNIKNTRTTSMMWNIFRILF